MLEIRDLVTIAVALLVLLGTYLTVRATRGKTSADAKTAFDNRVDEKMGEYADRLEKRLDIAEDKAETAAQRADQSEDRVKVLEDRVKVLEKSVEEGTRREKLLYRYTGSLRDHILNGNGPPAPPMPEELLQWYNTFETGIAR